MEIFIGRLLAVSLFLMGWSHLMQARIWSEFFRGVIDGKFGALLIGLFSLPIGLFIVLGHNIWVKDIPVLVTVYGWLLTIKSVSYLLFPRIISKVTPQQFGKKFVFVGALMIVLGGILIFHYFLRSQ